MHNQILIGCNCKTFSGRLRLLNEPSFSNRKTMLGLVFINNIVQGDIVSVEQLTVIVGHTSLFLAE